MSGGINLFGKCLKFLAFGQNPVEIPRHVVDVGCQHFKEDANVKKTS
jgi:hypothetical protein